MTSCQMKDAEKSSGFSASPLPSDTLVAVMPHLYKEGRIIHKGIFTNNYEFFYYTESDSNFEKFNVYQVQKVDNQWSIPKYAFFNSEFDDHGMSFSPDGRFIYFSSTRPTNLEKIPDTWHIWVCEMSDGKWSSPRYVDIPNMRDKLVSHPSITHSGKLYFHASNLDYSDMHIYSSEQVEGQFQNAIPLSFESGRSSQKCTPYISAEEDYLIFAEVGQGRLELQISFLEENSSWSVPKAFDHRINNGSQGNPFISRDEKFLLFTKVEDVNQVPGKWGIYRTRFNKEFFID